MTVAVFGCSSRVEPRESCSVNVTPHTVSAGNIEFIARSATAEEAFGGTVVLIMVSAAEDACDDKHAWSGHYCSYPRSWLEIQISDVTSVATFPVVRTLTQSTAIAGVNRAPKEVDCGVSSDDLYDTVRAESGAVVLTRFEIFRTVAGHYDLTFETGEQLTGAFDVPFCTQDNACNGFAPSE